MIDFEIDICKSVCVTGHRSLASDFSIVTLEKVFSAFIEKGFNTFLVGMAVGFDTICFQTLEKIRKKKDIKIVACIPCLDQDKMFSISQKKEYRRMIESADKKVLVNQKYSAFCMQERNQFMVDNSSYVIAYLNENKGGTANTVRYANKKGKKVINIGKLNI